MDKTIEVSFPGGKKVDGKIENMIIKTDQPIKDGGEGTAPEPFQLFLMSIATCAGIYALDFCQAREFGTKDMTLTMNCEFDSSGRVCQKLIIDLKVPAGFPEKYKKAIVRTMDLCSVKKHIINPPEFEIKTS
ncbi:MAG: osmotically inducible protein OsmC [Desulfobacterales bacterium PC51MH44]|nr:MAG: osmotically inducible protein OsmC [Desulfobacterales bacterium PC51MH44]